MVPGSTAGIGASIFHLYTYIIALVLFFMLYFYVTELGIRLKYTSDFKGLGRQLPGISLVFTLIFLSMAGLPPFIGFFTKYYIFLALMHKGYFFFTLYAIQIGVVTSFVYLHLIKIL
jgi:NADH-quinone oxidoreductase subunit N